jgi:alcohol dehydrogenase YqhD (iron-dependent ADH family)
VGNNIAASTSIAVNIVLRLGTVKDWASTVFALIH